MRRARSEAKPEPVTSNRAAKLRAEKAQHSEARSRTASRVVVGRVSSPVHPVTFRGSNGFRRSEPIYRQAANPNPRRQLYLSTDSGVELRLPPIPSIRPGWRMVSAAVVAVMLIGIFSLFNSSYFRVSSLNVTGLQRLTEANVEDTARLTNLSIVEVQPEMVKEQLVAAFPELADVQVQVKLPNVVNISTRERQPIMAWQNGDKITWIDAEGVAFPARGKATMAVTIKTNDALPLAPLTAEEQAIVDAAQKAQATPSSNSKASVSTSVQPVDVVGRRVDLKLVNAALQLTKKLPKNTQVVYDRSNGLGWNDPQGWQVFIGRDLSDFDLKFATYQTILKELQNQGKKITLISVAFPNQPFYHEVVADNPPQE